MSKIVMLIFVLTISLVAYQFMSGDVAEQETDAFPQVVTKPAAPEKELNQEAAEKAAAIETVDESVCLSANDLRAHPAVRQVLSQLDAASVDGPDVDTFRGIDETTVRAFAEQGDSSAMAVVGAIQVMRANNMDDSLAIDWLRHDMNIANVGAKLPLSADAGLALNDAAYWFYEAALHGRLFALQEYGRLRGELFGGAVGLNWLSQEEYDALEADQRTELMPGNLYASLVFDLAPQLDLSINPDVSRNVSGSETAGRIRYELLQEFHNALREAELPAPVQISIAAMQELETLRARICDSE